MAASKHSTLPISGIPLVDDQLTPARREITAWYNDRDNALQVSLFMRALIYFQQLDITERESYFQVAGIHSKPFVPWDGFSWENTKGTLNPKLGGRRRTDEQNGFCNHNMVTFPTWHRPYLLLFERTLWKNMNKIISDWQLNAPEDKRWRDAANQFRLPYWDWARKNRYSNGHSQGRYIPEVFTLCQITIATPFGGRQVLDNPLVKFSNPSGKPLGDLSMGKNVITPTVEHKGGERVKSMPWDECIGTSRYGINLDKSGKHWINGINDWEQCNAAFCDPIRKPELQYFELTEMVGRLLAPNAFTTWEAFSTTLYVEEGRQQASKEFLSLEGIHNIVHNITGGLYLTKSEACSEHSRKKNIGYNGVGCGHMSDVSVAAFDPIFWFHHCNIDRLTAIWQAFNPDLYFGHPIDEFDPRAEDGLAPFHMDEKGKPWTSLTCRYVENLHYTYDDLVPSKGGYPGGSEYIEHLRERIDNLYPHTSLRAGDLKTEALLNGDTFDDYIINILYDRNAIGGYPYAILFYFDDPTEIAETHYIGRTYTFSSSTATCGNCTTQATNSNILSRSQVPLTIPLMQAIAKTKTKLRSASDLSPTDKKEYLPTDGKCIERSRAEDFIVNHLQWKFVALGGTERRASDFPRTEVSVLRGTGRVRVFAADLNEQCYHSPYGNDYQPLRDAETSESKSEYVEDESDLQELKPDIVPYRWSRSSSRHSSSVYQARL